MNVVPEKPIARHGLSAERSEKALLSCLLREPALVASLCSNGITHEHFRNGLNIALFRTIVELHETGKRTDYESVAEAIERGVNPSMIPEMRVHAITLYTGDYLTGPALAEEYFADVEAARIRRKDCQAAVSLANKAQRGLDYQDELTLLQQSSAVGHWPKLMDFCDLTGAQRPAPPPVLIEGLLHRGSKLILGGTSKGRKTWALADLALCVATGAPWWGFKTHKAKVVYINYELQPAFFATRLDALVKEIEKPQRGELITWNLRGHAEGIEAMAPFIIQQLRGMDVYLIILDPIYKALGSRDENKAGDIATLMNEIERIALQTGAAVAFGAHFSKGNQSAKESIDRVGGSGVFARDPDSILTMTAHQTPDHYVIEPTLRNFAPVDPFVVRWDFPRFIRAEDEDPSALKGGKPAAQSNSRLTDDQKETLMTQLGPGERLPAVQIYERVRECQALFTNGEPMALRTFHRYWRDLRDRNKIKFTKEGREGFYERTLS